MLEKDIQRRVIAYLRSKGAYVVRVHVGASGNTGAPDLLVCYRGKFYGVEIKTPTGRQRAAQKGHETAIRRAGGEYLIIRSVEDAERLFP